MKKFKLYPRHILLKCWLLAIACQSTENLFALDPQSEESFAIPIENTYPWPRSEFEQSFNYDSPQQGFYYTSENWQMNEEPYSSESLYQNTFSSDGYEAEPFSVNNRYDNDSSSNDVYYNEEIPLPSYPSYSDPLSHSQLSIENTTPPLVETYWQNTNDKNFSTFIEAADEGIAYPFEEKHFDWNTVDQAEDSSEPSKEWIVPQTIVTDFTSNPSEKDIFSAEELKEKSAQELIELLQARITSSLEEKKQPLQALPVEALSSDHLKLNEPIPNLNQGKGNIKIVKKPIESSLKEKISSKANTKPSNMIGKQMISAPEVGLIDPPSSIQQSLVDTNSDSLPLAAPSRPTPAKNAFRSNKPTGSSLASKMLVQDSPSSILEKVEQEKANAFIAQTAQPLETDEAPSDPITPRVASPISPLNPSFLPPSQAETNRAAPFSTSSDETVTDPTVIIPPPANTPHQPLKEISINFNNVAMIEYVRFISRISNRNFIFDDEDLQFNVTIVSEEPTSVDNLMAALLQELRIRDLSVIEQGNNILIHRNPRIRAPARIVFDGTEPTSPKDSELVTRVFRLNTLDPNKASEIIKPLLSDDALVEVLRDSNNLIITDLVTNVNKIAQLIANLDAPNSGVTVGQYVVRNTFVTSLVELASQILQPIAQGNPFVLVPHSATNSIYIVSNPFIVEKAIAILENLDINEGRTKILSLERLKIQENAYGNYAPGTLGTSGGPGGVGPGGASGVGSGGYGSGGYGPGSGPGGGIGPGGLGGPGGGGAIGIPNTPGGAGGINVPGTSNYNSSLPSSFPFNQGLNIPGTANYNPNIPTNLPLGSGGLNVPNTPNYNPNFPPSNLPLGPGGIGIEGRPGAIFEENREFIPGGISVSPRWVQDLPAGHIERTLFFLYKLKYRRGDQIEFALRRIADSLSVSGTANADLVAAINSSQWIEASNSLIFTGTVSALDRIKELMLEVDTPLRQVFIEMLILDTTISDSLTYSVDWGSRFGGGGTVGGESFVGGSTTLGSNLDAGTNAGTAAISAVNATTTTFSGPTTSGLLSAQGLSLGVIGRHLTHNGLHFNTIGALVHALHTDTKVNIIMNPKIVTEDNNTAEIFVGSTDRYKTQSISNDQGSVLTNNFQFLDVGTTLRVTPLIGNNGIITLDIIEEVTNDGGAANATSGNVSAVDVNLVPVLSKTRTTTKIHVPDGCFVILSGMITSTESRTLTQIPCLGGIPLIGGISKQKGNTDNKRNLMIFIRPLIVDTEDELESITKRQQDVFREKCKFRRSWNYELDEGLDFLSIRPTDPDEIGCSTK